MQNVLLGTHDGVHVLQDGALSSLGLAGRRISAIHAIDGASILAGTYGDGMYRSEDAGQTWTAVADGLDAPAIRTIATDPHDASAILAGTEPGRIYRSRNQGLTWASLDAIARLPRADEWFLPYSPRAGAVRNIYAPPGTDRLLAAVEVGGLISSPDRGVTWTVEPILGDTDIHVVTGHPGKPDILLAALGWASLKSVPVPAASPPLGGVARSTDGGLTWTKFHSEYTRAVIVPPARPDLLLAAPARKVGEGGRIEASRDWGDSWSPASDGIETPMADMVERFIPAPDGSVLAVCSGGDLYRTDPNDLRWSPVLPAGHRLKILSVAFRMNDRSA